ncbi:MAG: type II toxin-antitoxin system RelE/ParE family toxin [Terriglobia bacterium]|jgi:mRNA-degrading endonuclease RelE of RelBE toxin-antitoxin system
MGWTVRVAEGEQAFIQGLPDKTRRQVSRSISDLEQDPFRGDVKPLTGKEWKGFYRKRAGDFRIIFFCTTISD